MSLEVYLEIAAMSKLLATIITAIRSLASMEPVIETQMIGFIDIDLERAR